MSPTNPRIERTTQRTNLTNQVDVRGSPPKAHGILVGTAYSYALVMGRCRVRSLLNQRFGRCEVKEFAGLRHGHVQWTCACDSGN
jgi:hypothetical protein